MLRILLLGPASVYLDDTPVQIQRRTQRALLFYLACRGGMVGRSELLPLFWDEVHETFARRRLTESLSKLRAELPDPDLLIINRSQVGLDFSRVSVDALEFQRLVEQAGSVPWRMPADSPLPEPVVDLLLRAVRLWRTGRFMAGVDLPSSIPLEDWLSFTTQNMEDTRLRLLERLAAHEIASGDLESALRWYRLALENDEANEELHYQILQLLNRLGRRSEVRAFGKFLHEVYRREGEAGLPARLQALLDQARRNDSALATATGIGFPPINNLQIPFTGRAAELEKLRGACHHGGVLLLSGEAGSGKSRLLQEAAESNDPPPLLLVAAAHPFQSALPYQPLVSLFRRHADADLWRSLPGQVTRHLSSLLPELLVSLPRLDALDGERGAPEKGALHEAIHQALIKLRGSRCLLLLLDNAHWADPSTCDALIYLLKQGFFQQGALLAITARPETPNPHLERLLAAAGEQLLSVPLAPLNDEDIAQLAAIIMGVRPLPQYAALLREQTGGNPLLLLETLRFLTLILRITDLDSLAARPPEATSLQAIARWLLEQLSPAALSTLYTACLVGNEFDPGEVEAATHLSPEQSAAAFEELEKLHMLRPVRFASAQLPGYYFLHNRAREIFLQSLSPARRRLIHLRLAEALERRLGENALERAAIIAQHYEAAGEQLSAYRWWLKAAQHARRLFSRAEAEHAYQRATHILAASGSALSDDEVAQLFRARGELAYEAYDLDAMQAIHNSLMSISQQRASPSLTGLALLGRAVTARLSNNHQEALDYNERALTYLRDGQSVSSLMEAQIEKGIILMSATQFGQSIQAFQQALAAGEASADTGLLQLRFTAHYHTAIAWFMSGYPARALAQAQQALRESEHALKPYNQLRAYFLLTRLNAQIGDLAACRHFGARGIELAEKLSSPLLGSQVRASLAHACIAIGDLDAALEHIETAREIANQNALADVRTELFRLQGDIYRLLGDLDTAIGVYEQGEQVSKPYPLHYFALENRMRLGMVLAMRGRLDEAAVLIDDVINTAAEHHFGQAELPALTGRILIQLYRREMDAAKVNIDMARQMCEQRGYLTLGLMVDWCEAVHTMLRGDQESAYRIAAKLAEAAAGLQNHWVQLTALRFMRTAQARCPHLPPVDAELEALLAQMATTITREPYRALFESQKSIRGMQMP